MRQSRQETTLCITANVALDRTLLVPDLALGHISRIPDGLTVPGGKGLNVQRALQILGGRTLAMGLLGGHTGRMIAAMFAEAGNEAEWTWQVYESRTCTILAKPGHHSTVINEAGITDEPAWQAFSDDILRVAARADIGTICLCGSLPRGAPAQAPRALIERVMRLGKPLWIDSSQQYLRHAIAARPYAIKVNQEELMQALDAAARSPTELVAMAGHLLARGIKVVVITRGADGALLLTGKQAFSASPPAIDAIDPIASGDCLLAGLVCALSAGYSWAESLRYGVAAGTVNALYAGGAQFPYRHFQEILPQVRVQPLPA